jgi:hypothetical protein
MDTWGIQGRVLPLFASVPRPVSNATACRCLQLRRSLTQRAVGSWADQVLAGSAGRFSSTLHIRPP